MSSINISIVITDPWEVGEVVNWRPLDGKLVLCTKARENDENRALAELDEPLQYNGKTWRYFVASPRFEGCKIKDIKSVKELVCAFIAISDERAKSADPLDTSGWRGDTLAFIGDVVAKTA